MHHLLKTMRIFAWFRYLQKLVSVGAIRLSSSIFLKGRAVTQMDRLVLQVKFRFMGCLVQANALVLGNIVLPLSSQLIVLVFTKQPFAGRYLANIFSPVFLWIFRKSSSGSKYVPKSFRNLTKIQLWRSLMLAKLQAFTGATTGCVL